MRNYYEEEQKMKKFSFGLFGLVMLVGNHLGSMLGIAIALCVWMILDGAIEEIQKNRQNKIQEGGK